MKRPQPIVLITLLLSVSAGYCDAVTFVSLKEFFSSHVTGNLVLFAYDLVKHADTSAWIKLLSFPIFIIGVMAGGAIDSRSSRPFILLFVEGLILMLFGGIWLTLFHTGCHPGETTEFIVAMMIVFAMGLQNAFGRIYPKKTYGPTTMMTGLVIEAALNIGAVIKTNGTYTLSEIGLCRQLMTIGTFLTGCILGALSGQWFGLSSVLLPGIVMTAYSLNAGLATEKKSTVSDVLSKRIKNNLASGTSAQAS